MTKFEALEAIAHYARHTVDEVASDPTDKINSMLVDSALEKIALSTKEFAPKRTPLELPLGVKLTRYSSPKEVVFIGTRTVKRGKPGETIQKVCRVIVDFENNVAHAYYDTKHIGDAYAKMGNGRFLALSGVEVLHSWLKCIEHNRDCRARRKAKAKAQGQQADSNNVEEGK